MNKYKMKDFKPGKEIAQFTFEKNDANYFKKYLNNSLPRTPLTSKIKIIETNITDFLFSR